MRDMYTAALQGVVVHMLRSFQKLHHDLDRSPGDALVSLMVLAGLLSLAVHWAALSPHDKESCWGRGQSFYINVWTDGLQSWCLNKKTHFSLYSSLVCVNISFCYDWSRSRYLSLQKKLITHYFSIYPQSFAVDIIPVVSPLGGSSRVGPPICLSDEVTGAVSGPGGNR